MDTCNVFLCCIRAISFSVTRDATIRPCLACAPPPYENMASTALEEMTDLMLTFQEKDKTVCILHHSNFAYLMLDMIPATPTATIRPCLACAPPPYENMASTA